MTDRERAIKYRKEARRYKRKYFELKRATEQAGHWVYRDGEGIYFDLYSCSECGFLCGTPTDNYCPNCGCRMVEPQERSE